MFDSLFRNTLAPWQWGVLLAVPPAILALYFLKLRRVPVEVPSTYLWMRAIEDLHVNSLWQRLRKSLLLLLQLLLVALAMLALLRPGWQGTRLEGDRFIFVVDNSASMNATDMGGGVSRLEASKAKVAALIDQMERGMTAMIISFNRSPRVVQEFTDNRRLLKERLATIEPTAASTDLSGALRLADGLANPGRMMIEEDQPGAEVVESNAATLYMFTDGRFADVEGFALGELSPIYVAVGAADAGNLAVTAFNTRRNPARPEEKQAFVQVANFTEQAQDVVVELLLDGRFLDARSAQAPAGGSASYTFPLGAAPAGKLEARIDADSLAAAGDRLAEDNNAFAAIDDVDPGRVLLVTPGNVVVETALSTARAGRLGGIEQVRPAGLQDMQRQAALLAGEYDLVIFDRCRPESAAAMPRAGTFFIGATPPLLAWQGPPPADGQDPPPPRTIEWPQVIDWNRSHPLMSYVSVGDLLIGQAVELTPPAGATALIDSTEGVLLAVAPRDAYEDLVLGFPILMEQDGSTVVNTKWYAARSFPTFWLNVLDYFLGEAGNPARRQVAPGAAVELRPKASVERVEVSGPGGLAKTLRRRGDEPFVFQDTASRGAYVVRSGDQVLQRFAVNLFDPAESNIRLRTADLEPSQDPAEGGDGAVNETIDSIRIGYTDVAARTESPARKELWRWVLLAAILVLVGEWYIYNRRVYL
ncbi:MAG: BatA and WFA domain-containing protein [Planctomycetota bacterium]